jgi:ABC-type branched-subunit amino acid transport system ATPase component
MIRLLGVGVPRDGGGWLLRRLSARVRLGEVTIVVSADPACRAALVETISGRRIPLEGRVWVGGVPLMHESRRRVRSLVARVGVGTRVSASRTVLWNVLAPPGPGLPVRGVLRYLRPAGRRAAIRALETVGLAHRARDRAASLGPLEWESLQIAHGLAARARYLVVHDVDRVVGDDAMAAVFERLRRVAGAHRVCVMATLADVAVVGALGDRILEIEDGGLVFKGTPAQFETRRAWRAQAHETWTASSAG